MAKPKKESVDRAMAFYWQEEAKLEAAKAEKYLTYGIGAAGLAATAVLLGLGYYMMSGPGPKKEQL